MEKLVLKLPLYNWISKWLITFSFYHIPCCLACCGNYRKCVLQLLLYVIGVINYNDYKSIFAIYLYLRTFLIIPVNVCIPWINDILSQNIKQLC